jgi:hypothetical protein
MTPDGRTGMRCTHCGTVCIVPGIRLAYGETVAPAQVDTMREEQCPVCGDQDSYNGSNCQVCGYISPPDKFGDPDLEKAKEVDLRGGDTEGANGELLQCDHCGAQFTSTGETPTAVDTTKPQVSKQAPPSTTPSGAAPKPGVSMSALLASLESVVAGDNPFAKKKDDGAKANPFAKKDDDATSDDDKSADIPEDKQPDEPQDEAEPLAAGSTCPNCNAGTLMPVPDAESEQADAADPTVDPSKDDDSQQPPSDGAPKKDDDEDDDKDSDGKKKNLPPWMKKKTSTDRSGSMPKEASRHMPPDHKSQEARNRLFQVIKAQQDQIVAQAAQLKAQGAAISFIAEAAGISNHPRLASLTRVAEDTDNGSGDGYRRCRFCTKTDNGMTDSEFEDHIDSHNGQFANKSSSHHTAEDSNSSPDGSFAQTSEQALAPAATDDVESPGAVPAPANAGVTPDAVTDVQNSNVAADQDPFNVLVDVTAPVAGANDVPSPSDARIQPYTNNGTPSTDVGFASPTWTAALGDPQHRFMAALVLARQEIKAGLTTDSDVVIAQRYAEDHTRSLAQLQSEAAVIEKVLGAKQAGTGTPVPRGLVPQSSGRVARVVPSVAATERTASAATPDGDDFLFG